MAARSQVRGGPGTLLRSGGGRVRPGRTLTGHPLSGLQRESFGFPMEPAERMRVNCHGFPVASHGFQMESHGIPYGTH